MKAKLFSGIILTLGLFACEKSDVGSDKTIGGEPLALTEMGNTFGFYTTLSGVSVSDGEVTNVSDGVSTTTVKVTVTNPTLVKWKDTFPYIKNVNGNTAEISFSGRVTDKGIQSVHEGKNFTLIDYDAKVGDKYEGTINGNKIVREVVAKSTTDDYAYGFMGIKVFQIEEQGNAMPGLQKIRYYANHKFGLVGVEAVFEDGSKNKVSVFSDK